jgi:hypothetical protein
MLSIITAIYKSDRYLEAYSEKIENFVNDMQKDGFPVEVILIPREPSNKEREFIDKLKIHPWCREVNCATKGVNAAWNSGFLAARGDAFAFCNIDDYRYTGGTKEALRLIEQGAELVYLPFHIRRYLVFFGYNFLVHRQTINKQVPEFNEQTKPEFLRSMLCGPFFVFKRSLFERVGPFDEQFRSAGDFDWCIRAAKIGKLKRGKELGGSYRVDGNGTSGGGKDFITAENNTICLRHHFEDKMKNTNDELMKRYDAKNILFQGQKLPVDENGNLNVSLIPLWPRV